MSSGGESPALEVSATSAELSSSERHQASPEDGDIISIVIHTGLENRDVINGHGGLINREMTVDLPQDSRKNVEMTASCPVNKDKKSVPPGEDSVTGEVRARSPLDWPGDTEMTAGQPQG